MQKGPLGSLGGRARWLPALRTPLLEAILFNVFDTFAGEKRQMHAFERWVRRDSSRAGQVSSSALCAKAPVRAHGPGRGPSRVAKGTFSHWKGKAGTLDLPFLLPPGTCSGAGWPSTPARAPARPGAGTGATERGDPKPGVWQRANSQVRALV